MLARLLCHPFCPWPASCDRPPSGGGSLGGSSADWRATLAQWAGKSCTGFLVLSKPEKRPTLPSSSHCRRNNADALQAQAQRRLRLLSSPCAAASAPEMASLSPQISLLLALGGATVGILVVLVYCVYECPGINITTGDYSSRKLRLL